MDPVATFERLNVRQREAACFGERAAGGAFRAGPLLIIAGAGTGKTNTLAHRVAHLVLEGVSPERILLLTFTRRAAEEMTRRARRIVGEVRREARFPWAGTFHSVANRLIRRFAGRVALEPSFSVLDRGDAADLMDVLRHELAFARPEEERARRFPRKETCLAIYSHRVNTQGTLAATLAAEFPWCADWEAELTRLFRAYVERKLAHQALDYDDLLLYWHAMMQDGALAGDIGELFDHVLVDEYQDTNVLQAEILRHLRPDGAGVTVVGDDAQAIYAFRAATVENILGFPAQYAPPARIVALETNYRSTQGVLDAANALIGEGARQYRKELHAARGAGARPALVTVIDELAQADYVAGRVLEARERGVPLRRQAVLFRNAHHSDALELELVRRNVPFVKYGGLKFLEAGHVKDMLSILRWADNPKHRVAAFRALQSRSAPFDELMRALGDPGVPWPGQAQRVREWLEPQLDRLYDASPARAGDLHQLERISASFATREAFLTELALDPPAATGDLSGAPHLDEDYLVLSTVHSAKGQEWESVHVLNVADGSFPSEFSTGRAELIEEERRLLYVAMTRARSELHLIAPLKYYVTQQAKRGDAHVYGARSRFLTRTVLKCLEEVTWMPRDVDTPGAARAAPPVDVAGRLRGMWA